MVFFLSQFMNNLYLNVNSSYLGDTDDVEFLFFSFAFFSAFPSILFQ